MGEIDWRVLFLSPHGRLARAPFWLAAAIMIVVLGLYESVVSVALHWVTGWIFYPVMMFCAACVLSKRLHDRGRSGWWAALILFCLMAVWPHTPGFFDFIFGLVLIWAIVELAVMTGEQGSNRFGVSPLKLAT
jgi:uncharacterized membrane protein YhaH (DUF805 family)